jgi:heme/copper-type cytochrome/quinol oxidase subunit 2
METPASTKEKSQESLSGKTKAITIGLVLAIIGSIISNSYAKDTITNYTGFFMLLAGIATFVLGIFATATATIKTRLSQEAPGSIKVNKPKVLFLSIWTIGIGIVLAVTGSILGSAYAKNTIINCAGFGILLTGICVFVLGIFGTALATLQTHLNKPETQSSVKVDKPRFLFYSILLIGIGIILTVVGSTVAGSYEKETIMNYTGFGMLLTGIAIFSLGISGTAVAILKNRLYPNGKGASEGKPRVILGSIWAIGIGSILIINGSIIASSYAKSTLMNYAGFGMLLAGTGVFVYGMFETARISAMGYLSSKRANTLNGNVGNLPFKKKEKFSKRSRNFWNYLVTTRALLNIGGIMTAMGLLFFSLWQLDLIVSGPVWWESSPKGQGWSWNGPGAYSNDYFQCFLWKTTVGQAYDTLFMLIFISFIVLFASAFFWPRWRVKNNDSN